VPLVLFGATLVTTTWAGAFHRGINLLREPDRWSVGLPYALALVAILAIHEMGHYLMARRRGVHVSLPYFIPVPSYLGTFGAFIRMTGPVRDRTAYFDVAIAGPLAGLVATVIALLVGLPGSVAGTAHGIAPSSSVLLAVIYRVATGALPTGPVQLGAIAFAGWLGLIVTALNLIPAGQLDGGHIGYALFGRRGAEVLGRVIVGLMVVGGLLYAPHLLMWALFVWFFAGVGHPPAEDETTPVGGSRKALAGLTLLLLLAIVLPWPG
jgi:membrane-associated protease RseP (regulator of RpoE activity)